MVCCFVSGEPISDPYGRIRTFDGRQQFHANMVEAPCSEGCCSFLWFLGQCFPLTSGCTQFFLRRKILGYDMSKYTCFQGYYDNLCCIRSGSCGESMCPNVCLCVEACCCNCGAISASRMYIMEKYDLSSDPWDYRLIRINNTIQCLSCFCDILAIFSKDFRKLAKLLDRVGDMIYHCFSGCMTAQVAHEFNIRTQNNTSVYYKINTMFPSTSTSMNPNTNTYTTTRYETTSLLPNECSPIYQMTPTAPPMDSPYDTSYGSNANQILIVEDDHHNNHNHQHAHVHIIHHNDCNPCPAPIPMNPHANYAYYTNTNINNQPQQCPYHH